MSAKPIEVEHLSKVFRLDSEKRNTLKERLVRGKGDRSHEFWALKDVSFSVAEGETFGLVGHNGSGKSTLLKVLAGIYRPTNGSVRVSGRVSALLEVGAGFHPELTGRENIYLNGSILGMSRKQIDRSLDQIIDFSGIEQFIDSPVKVYSSGMYVRLGFSIAVTVDPEILIVDEIIAVGDEEFQRKCFERLYRLRQQGTTIVLVTHSLGLVADICDRALLLDHGDQVAIGESRKVVKNYLDVVNAKEQADAKADEDKPSSKNDASSRRGSGAVRVSTVEYLGVTGEPTQVLMTGEAAGIRIYYEAKELVGSATFALSFYHENGTHISTADSSLDDQAYRLPQGLGYIDYQLPALSLLPGRWLVSVTVRDRGHLYDTIERGFGLIVRKSGSMAESGLVRMLGRWESPAAGGAAPLGGAQ